MPTVARVPLGRRCRVITTTSSTWPWPPPPRPGPHWPPRWPARTGADRTIPAASTSALPRTCPGQASSWTCGSRSRGASSVLQSACNNKGINVRTFHWMSPRKSSSPRKVHHCILVVWVQPRDPPEDSHSLVRAEFLLQHLGLAVERLLVIRLKT